MMNVPVGVIGAGKMGSALVRGWIRSGLLPREDVVVYDALRSAAEGLAEQERVCVAEKPLDLMARCQTVVIAVKPKDVALCLASVKEALHGEHLVVSIAAGLRLAALESLLPEGCRLARVMPNAAAIVGDSASAYCLGRNATRKDAEWVHRLFSAVGIAVRVNEDDLDAVTGLSGSGPAYAFVMIDALADAGVLEGLPREVALRLAAQTLVGAGKMVLETQKHPSLLKDEVTSPGGTTARGLRALAAGGLRGALMNAVAEATARSRELGTG